MICPRFVNMEITPALCKGCFYLKNRACEYVSIRGEKQARMNIINREKEIKRRKITEQNARDFFKREESRRKKIKKKRVRK